MILHERKEIDIAVKAAVQFIRYTVKLNYTYLGQFSMRQRSRNNSSKKNVGIYKRFHNRVEGET